LLSGVVGVVVLITIVALSGAAAIATAPLPRERVSSSLLRVRAAFVQRSRGSNDLER
jgi:hypothetical protein